MEHSPIWRAALPMLLATALLGPGCSQGPPPPPDPGVIDTVILVSIDSLRADRLGIYGHPKPTSPRIDALAGSGLVFDRAYTTTSWTLPSHAAMFTGLDDMAHGVISDEHRLPDRALTLAEALSAAGVETAGFFSGPYLHPSFGLSQGFDDYVDCTSYGWRGHDDSEPPHTRSHKDITNPILLDRTENWSRDAPTSGKRFIFMHMWDVHHDYIPPRSYVEMFLAPSHEPSPPDAPRIGTLGGDLEELLAAYDGEIRYTDDTLGRILDLFTERGLMERAAVIVLADHGEELLDHGQFGHKKTLYEEVVRIPLVIHLPRGEQEQPAQTRVSSVVSLIDVYPTVCDLLDVDCPYDGHGQSLIRLDGEARNDAALELATRQMLQTGLVEGDSKLLHWVNFRAVQHFDLSRPGAEGAGRTWSETELEALPGPTRDALEALHRRMDESREQARQLYLGGEGEAADVDDATLEHLRSLGYVE